MGKVLKIKVPFERGSSGTHYKLPQGLAANANKIQILAESEDKGGFVYRYGVVKDADVDLFGQEAEQITVAQAKQEAGNLRPAVTKITDQRKVMDILVKIAKKQKLTLDDQKALDENDPTPGVGKSKSFDELCDDYVARM